MTDTGRIFVVGDIHGCWDEFVELLEKAGVTEDDQIISVGDIGNRGPASDKTFDFFIFYSINICCDFYIRNILI